ncbi:hypothetical protein CTheo_9036 [Ceratobasidium theobromae]|uniref:Uncharacterized protein n=1 Tax=Ceratobasidium theobromae TaxID=1582974 RepID=A0A5N5Q6U6_9AGAM|nr:hypothetical protein CTheo_9036 [Ceratobasidium theobromae]
MLPESDLKDLEDLASMQRHKSSVKTKRCHIDDSSDQEEDVPDHSEPMADSEDQENALDHQMEALKQQMEALKAKKLAQLLPSLPQSEDEVNPSATNLTFNISPTSPPCLVPTTLPPPPGPSIPEPTEVGPSHAPSPGPLTQHKSKKAGHPKKTGLKVTTRKLKEELIEAAEVESSTSVAPVPSTSAHRSTWHRN